MTRQYSGKFIISYHITDLIHFTINQILDKIVNVKYTKIILSNLTVLEISFQHWPRCMIYIGPCRKLVSSNNFITFFCFGINIVECYTWYVIIIYF